MKQQFQKTVFLVVFSMSLIFTGCGPREASRDSSQPEPSELEIYYHADDEDPEFWNRQPESESAAQESESAAQKSESATQESGSATQEPEKQEEDEKIVITLVTAGFQGGMSNYSSFVDRFNMSNKKYRVELETCEYGEELGTMRDRLLVEVGAGKGPDIMSEDVFPLSQEIMDSGFLVDLAPYLEESGITSETFFSGYAPGFSGDRIYGVAPNMIIQNYYIAPEVLGDREVPKDMEGLVDMLLEYPGQGCLLGPQVASRYVLQYFLKGSEDLWGIIDWENNTCDFTAPIFSKILDVTKKGHEDGRKGYKPILDNNGVDGSETEEEIIDKWFPGYIPVGYYFDDGPHYLIQDNSDTLMVNANTEHLEGAYAFISYILSKSVQSVYSEPMNKELWEASVKRDFHWDEEARQKRLEMYEDARYAVRRTEEILEIVYDVSDNYIEGNLSKEETINQIQNRVQLYLNERK